MLYKKLRKCSRLLEESNKIARGMADVIKKEASYLDENIYCCYHNHYDFPVYSVYTDTFLAFGIINITIRIKKGKFELVEDKNIGENREMALNLVNRLNRM